MESFRHCPDDSVADLGLLLTGRQPPGPALLGHQRVFRTQLEWVPGKDGMHPIRPWSNELRSAPHALRSAQVPHPQPFPEELGWWNIA